MVRPFGPNLADLTLSCREAAEALKARNIPAQGKHAESVRRPGYNGDYVRVPRPFWPQSAKLTGAKKAMELTCLPGVDVGGWHPLSITDRLQSKPLAYDWRCCFMACAVIYFSLFRQPASSLARSAA